MRYGPPSGATLHATNQVTCAEQAECAELEEPSAFDIGKKKKKTEEPPASQGSIFDNIKSGTYTRSKPVGNPEPMASWGYSMSPLPPRGRRPSIDSDASKGDQDWKIVKVPLEGTGAEALMMGLQPLEKAAQGVPNGIKQYRQAVAHNKSMGIEVNTPHTFTDTMSWER